MFAEKEVRRYKPKDFNYGSNSSTVRDRKPKKRGFLSFLDAEDWRESNDYRKDYLKKNKGISNYLYICSQCFKPIINKAKLQVDHIIPPSQFATKKRVKGYGGKSLINRIFGFFGYKTKKSKKDQWVKTSIMARFLNHSFNCAAICPECNRKKSDKLNFRILRGYAMKSLEVGYSVGQFIWSLPFLVAATTLWVLGKVVGWSLKKLVSKGSRSKKRRRRRW